MPQSQTEKFVSTLQASSVALERHEKAAAAQKVKEAEVAALIPETADLLLRFGLINANEKEACVKALGDHKQTIELLKLAAQEIGRSGNVPSLGQQVDKNGQPAGQVKKASANGRDVSGGGYVGRKSPEPPESWQRLAAGLGVG
jgi:hypothetical protein